MSEIISAGLVACHSTGRPSALYRHHCNGISFETRHNVYRLRSLQLVLLAALASCQAKPLVVGYSAPLTAAVAPVAAAYTAPLYSAGYTAYSPLAYSAYTAYASPYSYYI
ncbi:hypothetical protein EVAR_28344_1 [Eumeta japonica]|uniref:Uncharacterized protein n=1 Tax=Eumeta variegata TaxID=151549 RepID=A0A4C1VC10_EUMVA|nr:hypothetical protein EVAR_28344_1 [Eumeta japonica]